MSFRRFITLVAFLLLISGQAFAAVSTSDLAGTWRGTMTASTSNPIYFTCNSSGTITGGQETLSDGSKVTVSGSLSVGGGGTVTGTMSFTFASGGSVSATTRSVTMTILTSPSRLQIQGPFNASYQPSGTDTLSVIRDQPYVPPAPDVSLSRNGNNINHNGSDAYPYIGVMSVPYLITYSVKNSGTVLMTVGSITASQQTNCSASVNTSPGGSISPGTSSNLILSVTPSSAGAWSCKISMVTNDPDENPFVWTITGSATATPQPEIQIQRGSLVITTGANDVIPNAVPPGQNFPLAYAVHNFGSDTLNIGPINLHTFDNCAVVVDGASTSIAAKGSKSFTLTIKPTAAGPWSFKVSQPSNDASEALTNWTVSGTARDEIIVNNQSACGLGGGFALFLLAIGLSAMSLFTNRTATRTSSVLVGTTAIAGLLLPADSACAADWNHSVGWNTDVDWDRDHTPNTSPINDWRLGYTMLPTAADISLSDKSGSGFNPNYSLETDWDRAGRTGVMWMTPWSGIGIDMDFFLAAELSSNNCVLKAGPNYPKVDFRSFQLTAHPGLWFKLVDRLHVEINPFLSLGYAQVDYGSAGDGGDLYYEFGLRLASYYTWRNGFQLGVQTGYLYGITNGESSGNGFNYDTDISFQGLFLGLQLGYRL